MRTTLALALVAALAAGCASLAPDKPVRPTLYDFGPLPAAAKQAAPDGVPLVLAEVEAGGVPEGAWLMYRLGYADPHQLRPYALARWSAPPAQLVQQRLRAHLGRQQPVLDEAAAATLARLGAQPVRVLRVELEEFSHHFDSTTASRGLVRLRCTLLETTPGGERLVAQRAFEQERPAPTADAPGGVRALAAATDAAAQEVAAWLQQLR